jgi:hypothetical protein
LYGVVLKASSEVDVPKTAELRRLMGSKKRATSARGRGAAGKSTGPA